MNTSLVDRIDAALVPGTARSCQPKTANHAALDRQGSIRFASARCALGNSQSGMERNDHETKGKRMRTFIRQTWLPVAVSVTLGASLAGCGSGDAGPSPTSQVPQMPLDPQLVAAGQQTFRFDTFGDETFWT